jgi:hypothetical protein
MAETKKKQRIFNFADQMRIGDIGEADFIRIYEKLEPKKPEKNRKIDFVLKNGKSVELKTDSYDMAKTPNFFMEKETITEKKTISGGPWRSLDHMVDFFVYYYVKNKTFFWFEPVPLVKWLDEYIKSEKLKPIDIRNKSGNDNSEFKSIGYKIPREALKDILLREHKV